MEQKTITRMIRISGMKQLNCENKIENELKKIQGIRYIKVKYIDKTVLITYDKGLVEFLEIIERVESLGYIVELVGEPINSVEKNMCNEFIAKTLKISGMSCSSCEIKIENEMKNIKGIMGVNAKYTDGTVHIEFDSSKIELIQIINIIESLDYKVLLGDKRSNSKKKQSGSEKKLSIISILGIVIIILVTFLTIKNTIGFNFIPEINKNMGYGILFLVGILTSLHCIAMCGGINLSQCVSYKTNKGNGTFSKLRPSMLYNLGRIISYTLIGVVPAKERPGAI